MEKLYSVAEGAGAIKVSIWTLRKWISEGRIRKTKCGGRTLVSESALEQFLVDCNKPKQPKKAGIAKVPRKQ
jgi:excisionase family DNA binding protein